LKTKLGRKSASLAKSENEASLEREKKNIHERSLKKRIDPTDLLCSNAVVTSYNYDSTSIRRPFDCLSKVRGHAVTSPASRSHADLLNCLCRITAAHNR